jgi:acyl-coenzyme A thioesterase PaaI-like protein
MRINPIELSQKIPIPGLRKRALDLMLTVGIPFNRWLGLSITEINPCEVVIQSPSRKLRENHVGGAHACAIALMGEYPAGLLVAQQFPIDKYRFVISELHVAYHKQGFGRLSASALAPAIWPQLAPRAKDSRMEGWVDLETKISNEKREAVATAKTRWQVLEM